MKKLKTRVKSNVVIASSNNSRKNYRAVLMTPKTMPVMQIIGSNRSLVHNIMS